jgi:hypothetical protein
LAGVSCADLLRGEVGLGMGGLVPGTASLTSAIKTHGARLSR